jgi:hypothetical protein
MKLMLVIVAVVLGQMVSAVAFGAEPGPVVLVDNGKAACVIVAPARTSPEVKIGLESANLLADHLQRMSGAAIKVVMENELGAEVRDGQVIAPASQIDPSVHIFVLVGETDLAKKLGVTTEGLGAGGLLIKTVGNALILQGPAGTSDPYGTRYAVVSLLEDLGCRYLWPGKSGKVIPHRSTVAVSAIEKRYTPQVGQRNIRMQTTGPRNFTKGLALLNLEKEPWQEEYAAAAKSEPSITWAQWQGLNGYALGITGGHAGYGLRGGWAEHGKDHPEWFALQPDGTRDMSKAAERWTLCVSNPQLIEYVANDIIARMKAHPMPSVSLAPNDGGLSSPCMCDECKKLDPPDAPKIELRLYNKVGQSACRIIEYPSLTDRHMHYWNAIAERVAKVYPNLPLVIDAYGPYSTPPVREKIHPNLVIRYVPSDLDGWIGWQKAGAKRIFWRPNNLHNGYREATIHTVAAAPIISKNMQAMAANGMMAVDIQGIYDNWATQGLSYYVAARTMWNPKLTFDDLLNDYCRNGFGPAAEPVKAYFQKVLALVGPYDNSTPAGLAKIFASSTPAAMAELKGYLDSADTLAGADEALHQRIAFLRVGLNWSAITSRAAQFRSAAQENKPFDKAEADRVLDQRWLMARDIFKNNILTVNVALVAGFDDTNWRDLGWHGPTNTTKTAGASAKPKTDDGWLYEDQSQMGSKKGEGK